MHNAHRIIHYKTDISKVLILLLILNGCSKGVDITTFTPVDPGLGESSIPLIKSFEDRIEFLSTDDNILKPSVVANETGVAMHVQYEGKILSKPGFKSIVMTSSPKGNIADSIAVMYKGLAQSDLLLPGGSMVAASLALSNLDKVLCYPWSDGLAFYFRGRQLRGYNNGLIRSFVLSSNQRFITIISLYKHPSLACLTAMSLSTTTEIQFIDR